MLRRLALLGVLGLSLGGILRAQETAADRALARLRGLAGDWEGTFEWSGDRKDAGKVRASYHPTGNGSAVVENLIMGEETVPSMTSVYHTDGPDLRMTHYCAAQNQPRLKANRIDEARGVVHFALVDATGLVAHPAHVAEFEIRFLPDGRLVLEFTFEGAGKKSVEHIELSRLRADR